MADEQRNFCIHCEWGKKDQDEIICYAAPPTPFMDRTSGKVKSIRPRVGMSDTCSYFKMRWW